MTLSIKHGKPIFCFMRTLTGKRVGFRIWWKDPDGRQTLALEIGLED